MSSEFDPNDKLSWFFGPMTREETNQIFDNITDNGVFLVRESVTQKDAFVLCVREGAKVSQYIINKQNHSNRVMFKIGDHEFSDIPSILKYYKEHLLDKTHLIRPAPRLKVMGKYDFPGQDADDLPFTKGEILDVLSKDEQRWWTARNAKGDIGQIPVSYVHTTTEADQSLLNPFRRVGAERAPEWRMDTEDPGTYVPTLTDRAFWFFNMLSIEVARPIDQDHQDEEVHSKAIQLPAQAMVVKSRMPMFHALETELILKEGDVLTITEINPNGKWKGYVGAVPETPKMFPFTHVKIIEDGS